MATNEDKVLDALIEAGKYGVTVQDIRLGLKIHHGTASGLLSSLHKENVIARLSDRRGKNKIYVLPRHVDGRKTERQGRIHSCPECGHEF
jgi:DNA-binding MarR family transcriptional regulator